MMMKKHGTLQETESVVFLATALPNVFFWVKHQNSSYYSRILEASKRWISVGRSKYMSRKLLHWFSQYQSKGRWWFFLWWFRIRDPDAEYGMAQWQTLQCRSFVFAVDTSPCVFCGFRSLVKFIFLASIIFRKKKDVSGANGIFPTTVVCTTLLSVPLSVPLSPPLQPDRPFYPPTKTRTNKETYSEPSCPESAKGTYAKLFLTPWPTEVKIENSWKMAHSGSWN